MMARLAAGVMVLGLTLAVGGCDSPVVSVGSGTFERAEHERRGPWEPITVVYWADGSSTVLAGAIGIPMRRGSRYEITRAGRMRFRHRFRLCE